MLAEQRFWQENGIPDDRPLDQRTCLRVRREMQPSTRFVHQQNTTSIPSYCDRFNVAAYRVLQGCESKSFAPQLRSRS